MAKSIRRVTKHTLTRGTRRSRGGTQKWKRTPWMRKRFMRGGMKDIEKLRAKFGLVDGGDDLYKIWSAFFYRKAKNRGVAAKIITSTLASGRNRHLYVIDMQNDFVDRAMPMGSEQLTGPPFGEDGRNIGEFAVGQGKVMIPDLIAYIKAAKKTHKSIVLSRDYHPSDHCSFGSNGGYFPVHCLQNSLGAEFISELNALKEELTSAGGATTTVIFKGFNKNVDSFSAAPFYANQTSSGPGCKCNSRSCSSDTIGGYTITGDAWARQTVVAVSSVDIFNLNPDDGDVIEVCGLAGDYCVRDTAIALKKNHPKCTVVVLNHLTRYAFLPTQIFLNIQETQVGVGSFPQHNNKITSEEEKTMGNTHLAAANIANFYNFADEGKGFNYYLFTLPPAAKLLSAQEITTKPIDKLQEQIQTGQFCHFITDHNTIIDDYEENGVELYIPQEIVNEVK